MSTIDTPPKDYPSEITGYAEPWIASPGDDVAIKVSCTEPEYSYRTVRVIQGVQEEHSPVKQLEEISQIPSGVAPGRFQYARPGSYAIVKRLNLPPTLEGIDVTLYFQAHLPKAGHPQAIISNLNADTKTGLAVLVSEGGLVEAWIGTGNTVETVHTGFSPARRRWIKLQVVIKGAECSITLQPLAYIVEKAPPASSVQTTFAAPVVAASSPFSDDLLFAATYADSPTSTFPRATHFFNGRIDSPTISILKGTTAKDVIAKYDFSRNISEDSILDVSGNNFHGVLINAPTRAVTGYDWDGGESDWTKAKYGYGAIHFHEDDLDDAKWETDFTIKIPHDARSGIYAVDVNSTNGKTSDMITFIVRSTPQTMAATGAKVALVLSTFTYLAYANEQISDPNRSSSIDAGPGFDHSAIKRTEDFNRLTRRRDVGLSNYDVHNDDSGTVFSSAKRPILNLRPGYVMWAFERPRELSADSMMIGFLERQMIPYDIVTDHDLHFHGAAALAPYSTVITGSHPEYPTFESYNAYENFARQGGNILYLGGNGFYWVSALDSARPWRLEVRRGDQGVRTYTLPGPERIMSLNGTQGGLWKSRGRSSHGLFGISFCAEGTGPGVPFKRTEKSFAPDFEWMFKDISPEELIGEFGLGGGASGDEIDSFDLACGSPTNGVIVATSTGHPDAFGIVPEITMFPIIKTLGTQTNEIRSDIVYYETDAGGAVFSVGSINWYCSLGWDDYKNNVAKLTENVIREFLSRAAKKEAEKATVVVKS
ncbi:uncharacterized protein Z519_02958 [Cladophialophora bantiana CBS 173.52]|uniref:N,N-dimethylformamidase beta subunit-like C-terminal domain-containing protein n=1 Tax=Cladophialophora bantiana (strain ATCC 10958 / CBS 173.52 / CDC B-1940 / NIH 8579) TaxID=1442370 RepID=A0A0D2HR10_CLAB1|nr:uncharacterized protein Z519_02958 [Cladophialophora bantiana CBS 173.52]KIW95893.1 hypothetical protein Z519_02958 [Cladophialophora bantiana CBS 173.52]